LGIRNREIGQAERDLAMHDRMQMPQEHPVEMTASVPPSRGRFHGFHYFGDTGDFIEIRSMGGDMGNADGVLSGADADSACYRQDCGLLNGVCLRICRKRLMST
jgi:hypothetical protein